MGIYIATGFDLDPPDCVTKLFKEKDQGVIGNADEIKKQVFGKATIAVPFDCEGGTPFTVIQTTMVKITTLENNEIAIEMAIGIIRKDNKNDTETFEELPVLILKEKNKLPPEHVVDWYLVRLN
jgi:hypothetical protein